MPGRPNETLRHWHRGTGTKYNATRILRFFIVPVKTVFLKAGFYASVGLLGGPCCLPALAGVLGLRLAPAPSWALSGAPSRNDRRLRQRPGPWVKVFRSIMVGIVTASGSGEPGQGERIGEAPPPSSRTAVGPGLLCARFGHILRRATVGPGSPGHSQRGSGDAPKVCLCPCTGIDVACIDSPGHCLDGRGPLHHGGGCHRLRPKKPFVFNGSSVLLRTWGAQFAMLRYKKIPAPWPGPGCWAPLATLPTWLNAATGSGLSAFWSFPLLRPLVPSLL